MATNKTKQEKRKKREKEGKILTNQKPNFGRLCMKFFKLENFFKKRDVDVG